MIKQHVITDFDTIEGIATTYLGSPSRKMDIISYNKLSYPYIVKERSDLYDFRASGYLKLTRAYSASQAVIKAGSTFRTSSVTTGDGQIRIYEVVDDTICAANDPTPYVFVRAKVAGTYGNVLSGSIDTVHRLTVVGSLSLNAITNEQAFLNGLDANVKVVGDVLYIPTDSADSADELQQVIPATYSEYLERLGQEDFAIVAGTILPNSDGDIMSVSGLDNIVQAITQRFLTEKGEYPLHPEYGTNIPLIIGQPQIPYMEKLIMLELIDAMNAEDRIQEGEIIDLLIEGTAIYPTLRFKPAGAGAGVEFQVVQLKIDYKGGQ